MVIPNFVQQALLGEPITVLRRRQRSRAASRYVGDVVGALIAAGRARGAVGQVFNIGNDSEEVTILDLAERVKERTGTRSEIVLDPLRPGLRGGLRGHAAARARPRRRSARSSATSPQVHLDEILDRVIAYFTSDKGAGLTAVGRARPPRKLARSGTRRSTAPRTCSRTVVNFLLRPALHGLPQRRRLRRAGAAAPLLARWPRSCSGWASTPASSASTTTSTTDDERRRLAGTVASSAARSARALFLGRGPLRAGPLTRLLFGRRAPPAPLRGAGGRRRVARHVRRSCP